jgi:hypothetical protein
MGAVASEVVAELGVVVLAVVMTPDVDVEGVDAGEDGEALLELGGELGHSELVAGRGGGAT